MTAWRFRKCLRCGEVAAASEFRPVGDYRPGWGTGAMRRMCPSCGLIDETRAFIVVRERHANQALPDDDCRGTCPFGRCDCAADLAREGGAA